MAGVAVPPLEIEPTLVRPITRSDYERMIEIGLFENERLELLRGVLVRMSPQLAAHASTVARLTRILITRMSELVVRIQLPLAVADDSEPEPDVAVVAPGDYDHEHPRTALLVIEVADSSLRKDRAKAALYAAAGVAEYWIVNLAAAQIEIYTRPDGDRYAESRTLGAGDTASLEVVGCDGIAVGDILPQP